MQKLVGLDLNSFRKGNDIRWCPCVFACFCTILIHKVLSPDLSNYLLAMSKNGDISCQSPTNHALQAELAHSKVHSNSRAL